MKKTLPLWEKRKRVISFSLLTSLALGLVGVVIVSTATQAPIHVQLAITGAVMGGSGLFALLIGIPMLQTDKLLRHVAEKGIPVRGRIGSVQKTLPHAGNNYRRLMVEVQMENGETARFFLPLGLDIEREKLMEGNAVQFLRAEGAPETWITRANARSMYPWLSLPGRAIYIWLNPPEGGGWLDRLSRIFSERKI